MFGIDATILVAFLSILVPGVLLSFALLRKTELHAFEITVIGVIFGLIGPATLTWLESYLMDYIHFFSFSLTLFAVNVLFLTLVGLVLCYTEGVFKDFKALIAGKPKANPSRNETVVEDARQILSMMPKGEAIVSRHIDEEKALHSKQQEEMRLASGLTKEEKDKISALHTEDQNRLLEEHMREEQLLLKDIQPVTTPAKESKKSDKMWAVWTVLLIIMILSFATRMFNISVAPKFFEFDPYFDMLNTESVITYGYQVLLSPSAWPGVAAGTVLRVEPLIPYLEAYWYDLANVLGPHYATFNTNLMSYVGSFYPPITAALLVFVVFQLLYHEYDEKIGLIGAALAMMMPVLYTTFIAGEHSSNRGAYSPCFSSSQATCLRSGIRRTSDLRSLRASPSPRTSSAHTTTRSPPVLAAYIVLQGIIGITRKENLKDFYTMNAWVLAIIIIFYAVYNPYNSTLANRIPNLLDIPVIVAFPLFSLLFVVVAEYLSNMLAPKISEFIGTASKYSKAASRALVIFAIIVVALAVLLLTPLGGPIKSYLNLSARFTTPSKPLFMTVQEYIPTGLLYNFGAQGFGAIGANIFGVPLLVWIISAASIILLAISIIYRRNRTGILYIAIALPLLFAGFSEVKYLPHLGVAYIIMFCIVLGEVMYLAQDNFKLKVRSAYDEAGHISSSFYAEHSTLANLVLMVGVFFMFGAIVASILLAYLALRNYSQKKPSTVYYLFRGLMILLLISSFIGLAQRMFFYGESASMLSLIQGALRLQHHANDRLHHAHKQQQRPGREHILQHGAEILATHHGMDKDQHKHQRPESAVLVGLWRLDQLVRQRQRLPRGDNAVAAEDYAAAANLVLGQKYNYTPQSLAHFMNSNQTKYVLMDEDLISKWQALDFLACINVNATSDAYGWPREHSRGFPTCSAPRSASSTTTRSTPKPPICVRAQRDAARA